MDSALVLGGDGIIANALAGQLVEVGCKVVMTSRRESIPFGWFPFDLKNGVADLQEAMLKDVSVVFICAAVTGFAYCAQDPKGSRFINVTRTVEIGQYLMQRGLHVVYLSSNAVFDGTCSALNECSATSPVTEYGRQKVDAELGLLCAAKESLGSCAVIRLTKVVDPSQPLYRSWMQNFRSQTTVKSASDLVLCPVTTAFVANALRRIGFAMQGGIYHLSGERDVSYYELSVAMAAALGLGITVERDYVHQHLGAVPSPIHSALSMVHTTSSFGILPQSLTEVVKELTVLE